jgi:tetratricopeptide (TPR) repeat protein
VECDRLTEELLAGESWGASWLHGAQGGLLTRRGDFPAARAQLDRSLELSPAAFSDAALTWLAELALWEGRHDDAEAAVAEGLRWSAERDPDGELPHLSAPWYPLALRLAADRAEQAAARRAAREVAEVRRRAATIVSALDRLAGQMPPTPFPPVNCALLLAAAERSRLDGRSDPERWRAAAAAWERLGRPFEAAYARFRQAEALLAARAPRAQVATVLGPAHRTAAALGAAPLRREIERLARRGRTPLEAPGGPRVATEAPPTAGLHVSHILAKLGVAGRVEAAAIAHRLGLAGR